jgi:hypothetical protein
MYKPPGFENWNRALRGAYRKGYESFGAGIEFQSCPYEDKRKPSGKLSWSRSFIRAWEDGWEEAKKQAAITDFHSGPDGNRAAKNYR